MPTPLLHVAPDEGDWVEDRDKDNGQSRCKCDNCGRRFIGFMRRVICKVCDDIMMGRRSK